MSDRAIVKEFESEGLHNSIKKHWIAYETMRDLWPHLPAARKKRFLEIWYDHPRAKEEKWSTGIQALVANLNGPALAALDGAASFEFEDVRVAVKSHLTIGDRAAWKAIAFRYQAHVAHAKAHKITHPLEDCRTC